MLRASLRQGGGQARVYPPERHGPPGRPPGKPRPPHHCRPACAAHPPPEGPPGRGKAHERAGASCPPAFPPRMGHPRGQVFRQPSPMAPTREAGTGGTPSRNAPPPPPRRSPPVAPVAGGEADPSTPSPCRSGNARTPPAPPQTPFGQNVPYGTAHRKTLTYTGNPAPTMRLYGSGRLRAPCAFGADLSSDYNSVLWSNLAGDLRLVFGVFYFGWAGYPGQHPTGAYADGLFVFWTGKTVRRTGADSGTTGRTGNDGGGARARMRPGSFGGGAHGGRGGRVAGQPTSAHSGDPRA